MNLDFQITILKSTRSNIIKVLDAHSNEQINKIPDGFSNNLVWNFGHSIITQQLLCYKLAGQKMIVSNEMVEAFRKGTKPKVVYDESYYKKLIELSAETITKLKEDYKQGYFSGYKDYPTSYGVTLHSIEDAISFNNVHEGHHFGTVLALRKFL